MARDCPGKLLLSQGTRLLNFGNMFISTEISFVLFIGRSMKVKRHRSPSFNPVPMRGLTGCETFWTGDKSPWKVLPKNDIL